VLGYPENFEIAICVAFGCPDEFDAAAAREPRPRLPFDGLVHWEKW